MMLYAGYCFINSDIRFTLESFSTIKASITKQDISQLISSLLNYQLKYTVNDIMKQETLNLLDNLQKELYSKSKSSWTTTFCILLILYIYMEKVQTATGGLHSRENPGNVNLNEEEAILACRRLNVPFAHMCIHFHEVFKSHKVRNTVAGKRKKKSDTAGFNPLIGEMIERNEAEGFGKEAIELISEIRSIMKEFGKYFRCCFGCINTD